MNAFRFDLGSEVYCQTGEKLGKLSKVAVNPASFEAVDLIVQAGFLLTRAKVLPTSCVAAAMGGRIDLAVDRESVSEYSDYREIKHEVPMAAGARPTAHGTHDVPIHGLASVPQEQIPLTVERIHQGLSAPDLLVFGQEIPVIGLAGEIGHLSYVVVDPQSREITSIGTHRGTLFIEEHAVPSYLIERLSRDGVFVSATADDLE